MSNEIKPDGTLGFRQSAYRKEEIPRLKVQVRCMLGEHLSKLPEGRPFVVQFRMESYIEVDSKWPFTDLPLHVVEGRIEIREVETMKVNVYQPVYRKPIRKLINSAWRELVDRLSRPMKVALASMRMTQRG